MIKAYTLKSGKKKYMFNVYLGIDPVTGKEQRKEQRGFDTEREAQLAEARALIEFEENGFASAPKNSTFKDAFELWWDSEYKTNVKESTQHKTMGIFENHILPSFGELNLEGITPQYCQQMINTWRNKLFNFRAVRNYANRVFDYAKRMDMLKNNPMDKTVMPKRMEKNEESEYHNYYTREELHEFLEHVKEDLGLRWYAYFRLLAYSGMRLSEGLALLWKDIDFEENTIRLDKTLTRGFGNKIIVQPPKTMNGRRTIQMDDVTMNILKEWKLYQATELLKRGINANGNDDQIVFSTLDNNYINLTQPYARLKSIQKRNGLRTDFSTHGFRHTHISLLFEAGATIQEVQDRVGHTDVATTMNIYTHVNEQRKKDTADKFANYILENSQS